MDKKTQEIIDFASTATIDENILSFPLLYTMTKANKVRVWQINVALGEKEITPERTDTDGAWVKNVKVYPITNELIAREELPKGSVGIYWTVSGQMEGKMKTSKPTFINKGTNIGKKNYTTSFTNAIRKALTIYNKKIKDGNKLNIDHLKSRDHSFTFEEILEEPGRNKTPWRVFPMAFHTVGDPEEIKNGVDTANWKHVKFPLYLQPKYDGTRLLIVAHPKLPQIDIGEGVTGNIDAFSRKGQTSEGQLHILRELNKVLTKFPGLYVDGELYKEGYSLQDISGSSRRIKKSKKGQSIILDFNIFDVFYLDRVSQPFSERRKLVDELFIEIDKIGLKGIYKVPTYIIENKQQLLNQYDKFMIDGLEGGMIRNTDSPYEVGTQKEERTYTSLKMKPRDDAEYEIKGYKEGSGKNKGLIIWFLWGPNKKKEFKATPNWTEEKRDKTFKLFKDFPEIFETQFKGQEAVIQYATLSKDNIPQQTKFLRFRKPQLDVDLNDLLQK